MEQGRDVLVRFHEIGLKGRNQPMFVEQLVANLKRATAGLGVERVWSTRMMVRMRLGADAEREAALRRAQQVFGAVRINVALRVEPEYGAISRRVAEFATSRSFGSFRISANRAWKGFPLTSQELNARLGEEARLASGATVDLSRPELDLRVDVHRGDAFVYADDYAGAGGLPVGTSGKVAALMSGGIDSPVAAWRMMRRGCLVLLVHFHAFPLVDGRSREKAKELAERLNEWQFDTQLRLVPFADVQRAIILETPEPLRVVAYRRFMARIAEVIARNEGARALVTGESVGQVGSQTLRNIATVDEVVSMPVLRPLIGMDKQEIIDQARAIGTFETSTQPDEDCCTLFVPRSASTGVQPWEIAAAESNLDVEGLVREAASQAEVFERHAPRAARRRR